MFCLDEITDDGGYHCMPVCAKWEMKKYRDSIKKNEETHDCKTCGETMNDEKFKDGKMCCDKPMFHNDEEE
jgi:hypothetical protein